ncbi:DUF2939 domain-containing protein [Microvirga sp. GCM10011540]|uniref:DUF2939 domain-containing protein n=1 Tax=Microvirga sp. GCM10011540 TaxID=3317338 RepID=UPI00360A256F
MIWTLRITFLLFIAWIVFLVSPFVALYDLSRAVEAKDVDTITERVNFRALRISLSRQIASEFLKTRDGKEELGGLDPRAAANAGAVMVNPLVEQLVTPQALIDLLEDGWPQAAGNRRGGAAAPAVSPVSFDIGSLGQALKLFFTSEGQGFRSVTVPIPVDEPRDKQFRLTLRLSGMTWRLTGVELPQALRQELIRRAPKATTLNIP